MSNRFLRGCAALAAALLVTVAAAPAQAVPERAKPEGVFYLEVAYDHGGWEFTILTCPSGHWHHQGAKACRQLAAAGGDPAAIAPNQGACPMVYDPLTVRAKGIWGGTYYEFEAAFGNRCEAVAATGGHLFDF
jgi:hypothetical protein